jgi:hypothetical protein
MNNSIAKKITIFISFMLLLSHITTTAIYLMPASPIKNIFIGNVVSYMDMFWSQDWHLFSPNPPTTESTFLVQCRSSKGQESAWLDITAAPKRDAFFNLVGPAPKLRYVANGMVDSAVRSILVTESTCYAGPQAALHPNSCKELVHEEKLKSYRETPGYSILRRYAFQTCKDYLKLPENEFVQEIKLRYLKVSTFPFTERKLIGTRSHFKGEHYDFPAEQITESSML